ncbi:hypothetical protein BGZ70_007974 [Mortierella alpina]|uniref:Uncharacterized protein n=1 Tax=Mortierella alpina TaxID=64518 RepID=A0A9P6M254_MORAP|nr:hypothetical protein BGZ70_007974 [Mortierella alpina]
MAAASAVVYAANDAWFTPYGGLGTDYTYSQFKRKATTFPSFKNGASGSKSLTFRGLHELRQEVADIYDEIITAGQGPRVAAVLADVVGNHLKENSSKNWAFTTVAIRQLESSVQLELVELAVKAGSSFENVDHWDSDHDATLTVSHYKVDAAALQKDAEAYARTVPKTTIANFIHASGQRQS